MTLNLSQQQQQFNLKFGQTVYAFHFIDALYAFKSSSTA